MMALPEIVVWEELRRRDIPSRTWHVDGMVTPGLNLLFAKVKQGKSWFSMAMAAAVASGQPFLGRKTVQGKVLYINTELDETASHERAISFGALPPGLLVCHSWSRGRQALDDLEEAILGDKLRMIVVDMLTGFIPLGMDTDDYGEASFWNSLRKIGHRHVVSILGLWHAGKSPREDWPDAAIGSTGLVGQSDSIIGLRKVGTGNRVRLEVKGNHGRDISLNLDYEGCHWKLANGDGIETGPHGLTGWQLACFDIVGQNPDGITSAGVAELHGTLTPEQVRSHLRNVETKGHVKKDGPLWYPVNPVKHGQTG